MQAIADRKKLAAALTFALKYVPTRTTIDVLKAVLITTEGDHVAIAVTDLDQLFTARVEAEIEQEGAAAVDCALLAQFMKAADTETVELRLDGTLFEARSNRARTRLPTVPVMDVPEPFSSRKPYVAFDLDAAVFAGIDTKVGYAVEGEKTGRFHLMGTSWEAAHGRLAWCATDGHVMSIDSIALPDGSDVLKSSIVPPFAVPKFSGQVNVSFAETSVAFSGAAADGYPATVTSKLIDGTFPDYRRVLPAVKVTARANRKALLDAIARCAPLTALSRQGIDLIHDDSGEVIIQTAGLDGADAEDRIAIEGAQFVVSAGAKLLTATLDSLTCETVEIGLAEVGSAIRFTDPSDDHRIGVVMPMRGSTPARIGPPARAEG